MAELFVARAVGLEGFEKLVVLKRVLPHFAENPRFVRSFLDEAKLVAGFDHPHIAHVYDMGMADGSYFFTMELVQGVDLRTILRRCSHDGTTLPMSLAILIARNIASALHYAHERHNADGKLLDVVHRDVSPANIIVAFDGGPKLVDFGIAKAASSSIKTQTGTLKGKISYMSPEQAKGLPIDRRTDIFALGIVLWEMLTSRRLYKNNDMATIQRIIYETPPSPRQVRREIPVGLEKIVLRALALDITKRYQTAQQLEADLEEFAHEQHIKQSTIELSTYMHGTFKRELDASAEVSASSPTVTDAVAYGDDPTTSKSSEEWIPELPPDDEADDIPAAAWPDTTAATIPAIVGARPRRSRAPWWVVGAAVLLAATGGGLWLARSGRDATPAATVTPLPPPSREPPVAAQPAPVVDMSPPDAAPLATASPPAAKKHAVKATRTVRPVKKEPAKKEPAKKEAEPQQDTKPAKPYDPNDPFPPSP